MNLTTTLPTLLLTIVGVCLIVYICEVAFEPERADEYTLSIRKTIRQTPNTPKHLAPFDILAFIKMASDYRIGHRNRLVNCQVKQNLDQFLQGTFCYLFDKKTFETNNSTISSLEWKTNNFCSDLNNFHDTISLFKKTGGGHKTIFVTRDPFDRFADWYLETCENKSSCYGCDNVLCTIEHLHEEILNASRTYKSAGNTDFERVLLPPQTWNCDLWDRGRDYVFVRYGADESSQIAAIKAILKTFRKVGVKEGQLDQIEESFSNERTLQNDNLSRMEILKKSLFSSKSHLDLFVNAYYSDYTVFNYEIPT